MDIKRLSSAMLISALVMMVILYFKPTLFGSPKDTPPQVQAAITDATPVNHPTTATAASPGAPGVAATTESAPPPITAPETVTLGSAAHGAPYMLEMVINNVHASVERVQLNVDQYTETVKGLKPLTLLQADPHAIEPFATTEVRINGAAFSLLNALSGAPLTWHVDKEHTTQTQATLYIILYTDSSLKTPWARVEKVFQIDPKSYEISITHHVINLSQDSINVQVNQMGPISLWNKPPDDFRSDSRTFSTATYNKADEWLYTDKDTTKLVYQAALSKIGSKIEDLGSFGGTDRMVWIAASNRFFTSIVRPVARPGAPTDSLKDGRGIPEIDFLERAQAVPMYYDTVTPANSISGISLFGKPVTVAAGGNTDMTLSVYMGPKKKQIMEGNTDAPAGSLPYTYNLYKYMGVIQVSKGSCSFFTFTWLALVILQLLDWIHIVTFNWGVAIIILVIIVRLLMHPLTRSSQVSMAQMQHKMAGVQPELELIKKKYPKDNAKQQQEKMRVFKEHNINPAGSILGCLPMLLQMPIWAALYAGLAIDIDLRHAGFIPGWITDLSNPDMVIGNMNHPVFSIPLIGIPIYGLNLLPILLGLVFFVQMRYSMKSSPKPADEQQAQTQKMSQFMFLLFPIMLYNAPSGLNLYILASSIAGFFDTWVVRKHLREKGILPAQMGPSL